MQLALIRHLPTEWNKHGLLQGSRDIRLLPITDIDKRGIAENIEVIKGLKPFNQVITSSLVRTQETAKHYGYDDFIIEPLINELNFGEFEGKKKSLLINRYEYDWFNRPEKLVLGESLADFEERIFAFLDKYKNDKNVLVFGHGSWIRALKSIRETGTIQVMNQVEVPNNQLTLLNL